MRPSPYRHWVAIQTTRVRCIGFFLLNVANPVVLTKIFPLRAQLSVGDVHEVLVGALPPMDGALPVGVISHDDGPDAVRQAIVDVVSRGLHHVVVDSVVTGHRDSRHLFGSRPFLKIQDRLPLRQAPVVLMVNGLELFSVDEKRRPIRPVDAQGQGVESQIHRQGRLWRHPWRLFAGFLDELHGEEPRTFYGMIRTALMVLPCNRVGKGTVIHSQSGCARANSGDRGICQYPSFMTMAFVERMRGK